MTTNYCKGTADTFIIRKCQEPLWSTSDCTNTCHNTVTHENFSHKLHKLVIEIFRTKNMNLIAKGNKEPQHFCKSPNFILNKMIKLKMIHALSLCKWLSKNNIDVYTNWVKNRVYDCFVYKLIPQSFMTVTIHKQHKNTRGEGKGKGVKGKLAKRFIHVH